MLIEFTVGNFRSIKTRQTFSMIKGSGDEFTETHCLMPEKTGLTFGLLTSAAIYGPNASGKTTLLAALSEMALMVESSHQGSIDEIKVQSFYNNSDPVFFEVVFMVDRVRHQYGFEATKSRIMTEWLYAYPKTKRQIWFTREFNQESKSYDYNKPNTYLTGQKKMWQASTRETSLFLSMAVNQNSQQLKPLYLWFTKTLATIGFQGVGPDYTLDNWCTEERKNRVLGFLSAADFSIADIEISQKDLFSEAVNVGETENKINKALKLFFEELKVPNDLKRPFATMVHPLEGGTMGQLLLQQESAGTQKMLSLAGPVLDVLENGKILLFDEFNNSLHPRLADFIISLFHNPKSNPKGAQLIFTTHDVWTLSQKTFRRDQIWFCERQRDQSTIVYPLSDYKPRKDQNFAKDYMNGRFGAQPFIECLDFFGE